MKLRLLSLLFISILVIFGVIFYFGFSAVQKTGEKERFVIGLGASEEEAVTDLKEKGFLRNKKIFNLILTLKGWYGKIKPGAYQISKSMTAYKLAKTLVSGPYQKWVVIPPGKRKEQVALILLRALDWPVDLVRTFIMVADEGYLYPDTYLINTDSDPQQVMDKLETNFNEKFNSPALYQDGTGSTGELPKDLLAQNIRTDTAVKIASLIERESGEDEDKPLIAGIIWNRLLKGMKLEIDATVQYALVTNELNSLTADPQFPIADNFDFWPRLPSGLVRKVDSPYNTYLYEGLPPGPICSPSIESIKAVAYPAETDAFYYLHSPDKKIHPARTFKEHEENIVKYLK